MIESLDWNYNSSAMMWSAKAKVIDWLPQRVTLYVIFDEDRTEMGTEIVDRFRAAVEAVNRNEVAIETALRRYLADHYDYTGDSLKKLTTPSIGLDDGFTLSFESPLDPEHGVSVGFNDEGNLVGVGGQGDFW